MRTNKAGGKKSEAARRALKFAAIAATLLFAAIGVVAILARLEVFGAGFHVSLALALGVGGTILLGVALMALSFYSNRSGADDAVLGMGENEKTG